MRRSFEVQIHVQRLLDGSENVVGYRDRKGMFAWLIALVIVIFLLICIVICPILSGLAFVIIIVWLLTFDYDPRYGGIIICQTLWFFLLVFTIGFLLNVGYWCLNGDRSEDSIETERMTTSC